MRPVRICPDCQSRTLERYQHYCSECGESREYFSLLTAMDEYRKTDKYKQSEIKSNLKRVQNGYFREYEKRPERMEYRREYEQSDARKEYKKIWALKKQLQQK